ncbi:hypothetical protein AB3S75_018731 [Citrus x aurantiifolia]
MRFGQVTLDKPSFFAGEGGDVQDMLPRHAKLQNMTYSPWMKVNVNFRREQFIQKEVLIEETKDIIIGRIPLMVKSDLCWMKEAEKGDCDFDHGGYFVSKVQRRIELWDYPIPFANHDHARLGPLSAPEASPQAIGFATTNPNIRVDTLLQQLFYTQRPLFWTLISDCLGRPGYGHNLSRPELDNG